MGNWLDGKVLTEKQRLGNVPIKELLMERILSLPWNRGGMETQAKEAKEIAQRGIGMLG